MYNKVLIADDLGSINQGVVSVLKSLNIKNIEQVQYCDDAYLKIKRGLLDEVPFELLITDLSFKADHREQTYPTGEALIAALKNEHPELKIIAYSIDDRLQKVRYLIETYNLDAYVCKGRRGLIELGHAIKEVLDNRIYLSHEVSEALSKRIDLEIGDYEIELIKQLSEGLSQEEISIYFKGNQISPNSLSSIEKRLNNLKAQFKANNAIHLVAKVKDLGLI